MNLTKKQKDAIRRHWPYLTLRFSANGTVAAKRKGGTVYGVLYGPHQTRAHLEAIGMLDSEDTTS